MVLDDVAGLTEQLEADEPEQLRPGGDHSYEHVVGQVDASSQRAPRRGRSPGPARPSLRARGRRGRADAPRRRSRGERGWSATPGRSCPPERRSPGPASRTAGCTRGGAPRPTSGSRVRRGEEPSRWWPPDGGCPLDLLTEGVVGVDDQHRQELVAAGDVAIDARRHHPQLAGDRTQRQPGGAFRRQLPSRFGLDRRDDLGRVLARGLPRSVASAHCGRSHVRNVSTALVLERQSCFTDEHDDLHHDPLPRTRHVHTPRLQPDGRPPDPLGHQRQGLARARGARPHVG